MEQQDRIMDGDLQTLGLQSILKMLALSGKTGTLFVHSGPETLSISLRKGQIVALREEGVPQPDLLVMLCLVNKLDPQRAQMVREHAGGNTQVALAMLVERNWMSAAEMQRRLEFAVTQSISHALRWVNGRFAFHRQLVPMENRMQALDIDSTLLEALRQADEWEEMGETHLTRTTVARWLPEIHNDVRSLGLGQEFIEALCLSNGEIPLQAMALVLMTPEARVARIMTRLLELRLITVLSDCINGLLAHHSRYAKSLRGRGQIPYPDVIRYLERRFSGQFQLLAQQYPILETIDCTSILTLDKLVKGEQLEEFYWEAVLGLAAFLRMVFAELLRDEVGNSHTGRNLNFAWKAFLTEIDQETHQYQVYRAQHSAQVTRGRDPAQPAPMGITQNWNHVPDNEGGPYRPPESRRRLI